MKVLVVGGGGREHALVWKLAQSPRIDQLYACPGNAGMADEAECINIAAEDIRGLRTLVEQKKIDLTVVGPEVPLAAGITDLFQAHGHAIFGPSKAGARLEASKAFCKELLFKHNIPTAKSSAFSRVSKALQYLSGRDYPLVVKADGLAAGKGVSICHSEDEAAEAVLACMEEGVFGEAGRSVIVEDFLKGEEVSVMAITDGRNLLPLLPCQDHKPIFDGDQGPNTGGMGAYCPAPILNEALARKVESEILVPTLHGLRSAGITYRGVLYVGLMITHAGPYVLEYNVRFGDPETQPLLACMKSDLLPILEAAAAGRLEEGVDLTWHEHAAVCVAMTAPGYPGSYPKGLPIQGLDDCDGKTVKVFHAGTKKKKGETVTAGGRVLGVTGLGATIAEAQKTAYQAVSGIQFEGAHYRTDIAAKALRNCNV